MRTISQDQLEYAKDKYLNEENTLTNIAKELKLATATLSKILKSHNVPVGRKKAKERKRVFNYEVYIKRVFNLSIEEYQDIYKAQNGQCAICELNFLSLDRRPDIDHCHTTGKVRGLLCSFCNTAIGLLKDGPDLSIKAATYLLAHKK